MSIRIFRKYWQGSMALLSVIELLYFVLAMYVATLVRFGTGLSTEHFDAGSIEAKAVAYSVVMSIAMGSMGLYSSRQRSRTLGLLMRIVTAALVGAAMFALLSFVAPALFVGRGVLLICVTLTVLGLFLCRYVFERIAGDEVLKRRVLVYGAGARASSLTTLRRRSDRRGFSVAGFVATAGDTPGVIPSEQILPAVDGLPARCRSLRISEIVVAMDDRRQSFPFSALLECRLAGIRVTEIATFLERETGKVRLDVLTPSWMIFSDGFGRHPLQFMLERLFDLCASLVLFTFTWPIMLLSALAIKFEDGWYAPVMYRQVRVGQHGQPFRLLKFRSMGQNAEYEGGPRWAAAHDERVTRVGAVMRKLRIDELPQLFNVIAGDMSLVGPRPERPEFVSMLSESIPYYRERHAVKPGVTGWAQLCYPYGASERDATEKLQYDLFYVKNRSLLLYLVILMETVEVILWSKGAR